MSGNVGYKNGGAEGDRTPDLYTASVRIAPFTANLRRTSRERVANRLRTGVVFGPSRSQAMFGPQTVVAHREALTKAKGKFTMAGSRSSASWVYFIQAGESGPVKIGVAGEPQTRLRIIQSGHFEELRLLCAVYCGKHGDWIEQRLHSELQEHRLRGEWFRPSPAVLAVIAKTIAGEAFIRGMDGPLLRSTDNAPLYLEPIPRPGPTANTKGPCCG